MLYVLCTSYLSFLVFKGEVNVQSWNALFWIILIFAAVQAAFRSFQNEADRRFLLYFSLLKPQWLIMGKTLYNFFYLLFIGLFTLLVFLFLMGTSLADSLAFITILIIGSAGFASILTLVAGLSAKAGDNPALPAILSIPLLYPQVIALTKVSMRALTGFDWALNLPVLLVLLLLSIISILLSYLLFSYLWRD